MWFAFNRFPALFLKKPIRCFCAFASKPFRINVNLNGVSALFFHAFEASHPVKLATGCGKSRGVCHAERSEASLYL